jgi:hypothetical protein
VITEEAARNFAFGRAGQVLLSFRELGSIGVLDLEREELVFALRGYWLGQHDPDILPNGNLLVFDNMGYFARPEGRSRVIEFDPATMQIVWQYAGTAEQPLESVIRADQQRLANGNTLITESNGGRIVEVAPDGAIVWQFVNPVRGGEQDERIPIICWAQRLGPDELDSAFLKLDEPAPEQRGWLRAPARPAS